MSLLENYYDRFWSGRFEATFAGTDVGRDPTGEQSRYVVLRFDFSAVNDTLETLEREFETYCTIELRGALRRHPDLFPEAALRDILAPPSIANKLAELFRYAGDHDIPLYVLIDEYDNFANTVLAHHGAEAYNAFTHGGGFYRNFFAALKSATSRSGGGLERLFIIGVSPVTMDDVKRLMYGYLRDGYRDVGVFSVNLFRFEQLMLRMANEGEWRPVLEFLGEAIARQTGIRDYIAGEKVMAPRAGALGFLAAYLSVADYYVFRSEAELGKGHADIALEPLVARYPHLRRGYLIELKYLKRSERLQRSETLDEVGVAATAGDAKAQLARYLADERLARQFPGVRFTGLVVVFHGWELAYCDAVTASRPAPVD